ncbi:hypothetical protein E1B28_002976 [Marasmius oreades]|uniref:Uncharacterized protein n=1 Tax=Marasmius oreades TaxID=181124 RepID=A0A9P7UK40_9AGAR|nr:uncharacterized protein E1B28_002976 [Marasmius oreades]KAG7085415.1 hypothetical protein E1B28_002976 [Marasmius oreades]
MNMLRPQYDFTSGAQDNSSGRTQRTKSASHKVDYMRQIENERRAEKARQEARKKARKPRKPKVSKTTSASSCSLQATLGTRGTCFSSLSQQPSFVQVAQNIPVPSAMDGNSHRTFDAQTSTLSSSVQREPLENARSSANSNTEFHGSHWSTLTTGVSTPVSNTLTHTCLSDTTLAWPYQHDEQLMAALADLPPGSISQEEASQMGLEEFVEILRDYNDQAGEEHEAYSPCSGSLDSRLVQFTPTEHMPPTTSIQPNTSLRTCFEFPATPAVQPTLPTRFAPSRTSSPVATSANNVPLIETSDSGSNLGSNSDDSDTDQDSNLKANQKRARRGFNGIQQSGLRKQLCFLAIRLFCAHLAAENLFPDQAVTEMGDLRDSLAIKSWTEAIALMKERVKIDCSYMGGLTTRGVQSKNFTYEVPT